MTDRGTSPKVLTCLMCGKTIRASAVETSCRCGTVRSFGYRMYVSNRKPRP